MPHLLVCACAAVFLWGMPGRVHVYLQKKRERMPIKLVPKATSGFKVTSNRNGTHNTYLQQQYGAH